MWGAFPVGSRTSSSIVLRELDYDGEVRRVRRVRPGVRHLDRLRPGARAEEMWAAPFDVEVSRGGQYIGDDGAEGHAVVGVLDVRRDSRPGEDPAPHLSGHALRDCDLGE